MKKEIYLTLLVAGAMIFHSCGDSNTNNEVSANTTTTNNTTLEGDTSKKKSDIEQIADATKQGVELIKDGLAEKRKADSIRNANEPRIWVYQIGESYNDDERVAKEYDKYKGNEPDLFIFKKKRKEFYLLKGIGAGFKIDLKESISELEKRFSARVSHCDLSMMCRKMPINTKSIKYKVDGEKKEAECKTCE